MDVCLHVFTVHLYILQVSIHSVWLGNNITPLREEEWGEDEEDEADAPAPASPPVSPINSRSEHLLCSLHGCGYAVYGYLKQGPKKFSCGKMW